MEVAHVDLVLEKTRIRAGTVGPSGVIVEKARHGGDVVLIENRYASRASRSRVLAFWFSEVSVETRGTEIPEATVTVSVWIRIGSVTRKEAGFLLPSVALSLVSRKPGARNSRIYFAGARLSKWKEPELSVVTCARGLESKPSGST